MKNRDMCFIALMAALLCLIGPLAIPVGPVSLSLMGFGVCLAGGVLGSWRAAAAAMIYILLGTAGFPVFAGWNGGAVRILGPTGGFILGYAPCAAVCGLARGRSKGVMLFWMCMGMLTLYAIGTVWFIAQTRVGTHAAVTACILPFAACDVVKIIAAACTAERVNRSLRSLER